MTATVYEGKQLLLHLINTVWANFYSAFSTYHAPAAVAYIRCTTLPHFIVAHDFRFFSEGSSVLMRFLCVTAFFPVFSPGIFPVSSSITRCIPHTFYGQTSMT